MYGKMQFRYYIFPLYFMIAFCNHAHTKFSYRIYYFLEALSI